ncbi:hypothetical protein NIES4102_28530 [Chondrocystis sp. NIES-4102]|nr:hypothetical protein NIES4102_28530 [Chondrocystis sp. NIES-4102]
MSDQSAQKARNILLTMFLLQIVLDIILVAIANDLWAIGRILVTIVIMYFVLQGRKWAKWALIGILSFLIVALIALVIALYSKLSSIIMIGSLLLAFLSAIIIIYLLRSQNLNHYFLYKRQASNL